MVDRADDIQGGRPSAAGEDPSVGLLLTSTGTCTGVVIDEEIVATAGHCIVDDARLFFTGKGAAAASSRDVKPKTAGMIQHRVVDYVRYDDGSRSFLPDVALVRLDGPAPDLVPARGSDRVVPVGTRCTIVGFGRHDANGSSTVGLKRRAEVDLVDSTRTGWVVKAVDGIADSGDSGGPLFCNGAVVGTTWARRADVEWPEYDKAAYARFDYVAAWIREQLDGWRNAPYPPANDPPSWYRGD